MNKQTPFFPRRLLSLVLSLVLMVTLFALPVSAASNDLIEVAVSGKANYAIAFEVLDLVNAERKKAGVSKLEMDKTMLEYAMQRAAECAVYYSHTRPDGESCFTIIKEHRGAGENIAAGYENASLVMDGWMNSEDHKANILNAHYKSLGVGVFKIGEYYYWCQMFNGMAKQSSPTQKKPVTETRAITAKKSNLDLSINATKLTLKDGHTGTIAITNCNPGFPVYDDPMDPSGFTYTPAKSGIVTVSKSGVVTPINNGSTTITVKSKNGVKLFTVSVTVNMKNPHTEHDYAAATCSTPKTCKVCGVTSGSKLSHKYAAATCTKAKTCTLCGATSGSKLGHKYDNDCDKSCNVCAATRSVAAHTYKKVITKATTTKDGAIKNVCTKCNYTASKVTTLYKASKISLSTTAYTYNGKVQKPSVVVKDSKGNTISKSNYTVTYASGRKNVGTYKVTIKMKGNYSGTKTLTFKINPVKTTVKATAATKSLKLTITKKSTQVTGYEVQYSTSKSFKSYKTKTVSSYKTTSTSLTGLKAKTTYYVRVRTYKTVNGVKYYSGWSTIVSKKTK